MRKIRERKEKRKSKGTRVERRGKEEKERRKGGIYGEKWITMRKRAREKKGVNKRERG